MKACDSTCRADLVKSSFRVTGIWPTKKFNVDHGLFNPSNIYTDAETNSNVRDNSVVEPAIAGNIQQSEDEPDVAVQSSQSGVAEDFLEVAEEENIINLPGINYWGRQHRC